MSKITGVNQAAALNSVSSTPAVKPAAAKSQQQQQQADTVEISAQARQASRLADIPPVRAELVARVKAEIQAGTYETSEKLDKAIERLLAETDL